MFHRSGRTLSPSLFYLSGQLPTHVKSSSSPVIFVFLCDHWKFSLNWRHHWKIWNNRGKKKHCKRPWKWWLVSFATKWKPQGLIVLRYINLALWPIVLGLGKTKERKMSENFNINAFCFFFDTRKWNNIKICYGHWCVCICSMQY